MFSYNIKNVIYNVLPRCVTVLTLLAKEEGRLDILKIYSRRKNLTRGINIRKIAEQMGGSSGAKVNGVCTEAGMFSLRERRVHVM